VLQSVNMCVEHVGVCYTKKCVAVRGSVLHSVNMCEHVCDTRVSVCCSVLQCVAVCCSVLQCEHVFGTRVSVATHEGDFF